MKTGIEKHPDWYPGLSQNSRFEDFQNFLHEGGNIDCPRPCPHQCLCIFDIDRTLTGQQGRTDICPKDKTYPGVWDNAYDDGDLTLSELGQGINKTFCGECRLGVVSHGTAGGQKMKEILLSELVAGYKTLPNRWSWPSNIDSPLVLGCGHKPPCVQGVVNWYGHQGVPISRQDVYFFDDRRDNVEAVGGAGFNSLQISCATRDGWEGKIGGCGATLAEIKKEYGTHVCSPLPPPTPAPTTAGACHTAVAGEKCYGDVDWAMKTGIHQHPEWYPGLSQSSSFEEFQTHMHDIGYSECPMPCREGM
jgi:hypothetical protein